MLAEPAARQCRPDTARGPLVSRIQVAVRWGRGSGAFEESRSVKDRTSKASFFWPCQFRGTPWRVTRAGDRGTQWISTTGMRARCRTRVAVEPSAMPASADMPRVPM